MNPSSKSSLACWSLAMSHEKFIRKLVNKAARLHPFYEPIKEDIHQEAMMYLFKLAERYDPAQGAFTSYVGRSIELLIHRWARQISGASERHSTTADKRWAYDATPTEDLSCFPDSTDSYSEVENRLDVPKVKEALKKSMARDIEGTRRPNKGNTDKHVDWTMRCLAGESRTVVALEEGCARQNIDGVVMSGLRRLQALCKEEQRAISA